MVRFRDSIANVRRVHSTPEQDMPTTDITTPITSTTLPTGELCTNIAAVDRPNATATAPGAVQRRSSARRGIARSLAGELGQGTVEYVGLLLLMATLLAAIVGAASQLGGRDEIGKKVVEKIGQSIDRAGGDSR
ncbi:MAG: hypothetical protein QM679_03270 [Patulibacter sp.]